MSNDGGNIEVGGTLILNPSPVREKEENARKVGSAS